MDKRQPTSEIPAPHTQDQTESTFDEKLETLIDGSLRRNFNPWTDIPWDDPDYAIHLDDPRLKLQKGVDLGAHPWYWEQTDERQIELGIRRMMNVMKVGLQFEQFLVQAIMAHNAGLRNGNQNFFYTNAEAREELFHTDMFQETVNRSGVDTKGARTWFRKVLPLLTPAASLVPTGMWGVVLAGEEPIDHMQKEMLRNGDAMHPLIQRVMAIHVAEEGRHISYAHERLSEDVPKMGTLGKIGMAVGLPASMRILGDVITKPSPEEIEAMGVPQWVADEVWGAKTKEGKQRRSELFPDARMLAENIGIKTPEGQRRTLVSAVGDVAWRAFGIHGRSSRFRSEPNRTHAVVAESN